MAWKSGISAIERAFQIAASGRVKDMQELRAVLNREGYDYPNFRGLRFSNSCVTRSGLRGRDP